MLVICVPWGFYGGPCIAPAMARWCGAVVCGYVQYPGSRQFIFVRFERVFVARLQPVDARAGQARESKREHCRAHMDLRAGAHIGASTIKFRAARMIMGIRNQVAVAIQSMASAPINILRAVTALVVLALAAPVLAQNPIGAGSVPGGEYEIGPEDLLDISVWKEKDLQREVLVRPDGWMTFPLVGNIRAKGRTAQHLQEEITDRLRRYIPDPVVTVSVKKVAGYKIYVIGKVNKPGEFVVGRYVDILQALTLAGGLTPFAAEDDIRVVRKEERENGEIKETVLRFDYTEVKKGRRLEQNINLKSGDVVVVP